MTVDTEVFTATFPNATAITSGIIILTAVVALLAIANDVVLAIINVLVQCPCTCHSTLNLMVFVYDRMFTSCYYTGSCEEGAGVHNINRLTSTM